MASNYQNPEGWDEIQSFASPSEYQRFLLWIQSAIDEEALTEIPVQRRYGPSEMFDERWFAAPSGQRWRLVAPEPPFLGVFLMLESAVGNDDIVT
ncbi:hypothetical protein GCM10025768_06740 [Microbacterium pseudoresistens]|uniref:Uncharacterized protein n=1 Tax=Microbacterium pseudoresistens TaxID=640634 RepID=A0A7Y9EVE2_9MICO|nr:hypothetical protein [Microbacterium pseudoresistens]NYD54511.1 hypothetical protein [Microbacterium pseudoresistens]